MFNVLDVLAAVGLALSVSGIIGFRYFNVDSRPESMSFYERLGFRVAANLVDLNEP